MNKENLRIIHKFIQRRGDEIQSILPALPGHPVRQAQAHLYKEIKIRFGVPVKEIGDARFEEVMKLLELCCEHAADPHVGKYLTWVVPEPGQGSLESFFE